MKTLLFTVITMLTASNVMACPGGHLKLLQIGDREIGQVDMSVNQVRTTDNKSELLSIAWKRSGDPKRKDRTYHVCPTGNIETCDYNQGLVGIPELDTVPNSLLTVRFKVDGKVETFEVTRFGRTRGCGAKIEAKKN